MEEYKRFVNSIDGDVSYNKYTSTAYKNFMRFIYDTVIYMCNENNITIDNLDFDKLMEIVQKSKGNGDCVIRDEDGDKYSFKTNLYNNFFSKDSIGKPLDKEAISEFIEIEIVPLINYGVDDNYLVSILKDYLTLVMFPEYSVMTDLDVWDITDEDCLAIETKIILNISTLATSYIISIKNTLKNQEDNK